MGVHQLLPHEEDRRHIQGVRNTLVNDHQNDGCIPPAVHRNSSIYVACSRYEPISVLDVPYGSWLCLLRGITPPQQQHLPRLTTWIGTLCTHVMSHMT